MTTDDEIRAAAGRLAEREAANLDDAEMVARAYLNPWRPIGEAPTNQSVLVYLPNWEHYGPGIYRAILVDMGTGRRWQTTCWAMGRSLPADLQPTAWMPLPPAPAA